MEMAVLVMDQVQGMAEVMVQEMVAVITIIMATTNPLITETGIYSNQSQVRTMEEKMKMNPQRISRSLFRLHLPNSLPSRLQRITSNSH